MLTVVCVHVKVKIRNRNAGLSFATTTPPPPIVWDVRGVRLAVMSTKASLYSAVGEVANKTENGREFTVGLGSLLLIRHLISLPDSFSL